MNTCSIHDCANTIHGRGWCSKHYMRWLSTGSLERKTEGHGMRRTPEYSTWTDIKTRCYNPKRWCYKNYGGRGIKMCDKWKDSFIAFYNDVGKNPNPRLTLDRIDNDGNYEPGNVRWATKSEQAFNRRLFSNNTSGHKGISKYGKKWMVYSNKSGKRKTVGYAKTLAEAVTLRNNYEKKFA